MGVNKTGQEAGGVWSQCSLKVVLAANANVGGLDQ